LSIRSAGYVGLSAEISALGCPQRSGS